MHTVFYIIAKTIYVILDTVSITLFVRMILSLFSDGEPGRFYMLTYYITEPFIAPVRALMAKLNIGQNSPIDWSFFVTALLISLIQTFLPII